MLKARPMRAKILLGLWLCLAFSLPALAQTENQRADSSAPDTQSYFSTSPKAVTLLYPDQGEVHEEFTLSPAGASGKEIELVIYLPGASDPQSLTLNFAGGRVLSINNESVAPGEDDPLLAFLRTKVEAAQAETRVLEARLNAVQARINSWNNTPAPTANIVTELERLDAARQKYVPALAAEAAELVPQVEKAKLRQTWLEGKMLAHTASWRVRVALLREKPGDRISYSYIMNDCGWEPVYRLEASPDQKSVHFAMNAKFWQKSGFDWKNTLVSLSTMPRGLGLSPRELYAWNIGLMQNLPENAQREVMSKVDSGEIAASAGYTAKPMSFAPPEEEQRATYALWKLGAKDLISEQSASVTLLEEDWKAEFSVTLRPWTEDQGYLTAKIDKSKTSRGLPDGQALYFVDGSSAGQELFSPLSDDSIFFGADPMISSEMVLLDSKSDETGIISKDRTMIWDWRITVHNKRKVEIPVRVEDSRPIVGDGRIVLDMESNPMPKTDEEKHSYFWEKNMAPESEWIISHKLKITAPANLPVVSTR